MKAMEVLVATARATSRPVRRHIARIGGTTAAAGARANTSFLKATRWRRTAIGTNAIAAMKGQRSRWLRASIAVLPGLLESFAKRGGDADPDYRDDRGQHCRGHCFGPFGQIGTDELSLDQNSEHRRVGLAQDVGNLEAGEDEREYWPIRQPVPEPRSGM